MLLRILLVLILVPCSAGIAPEFPRAGAKPQPNSDRCSVKKFVPIAIRYRQQIYQKIVLPPAQIAFLLVTPAGYGTSAVRLEALTASLPFGKSLLDQGTQLLL